MGSYTRLRHLGAFLVLAVFAVLFVGTAKAADTGFHGAEASKKSYRAIFHVDSDAEGAMKKTIGNINNLLNDPRLSGKIEIELLANSKGYKIYDKTNGLEKSLLDLKSKGVILAQCNNTLRELKVDPATLYSFISIVPSGVGELVIRQADGWAYIHPSP